MSEKLRESLSALMDDEANELELERVLSQIDQNEDLRQVWSRFNSTRVVLAGEQAGLVQTDISRRVKAALSDEQSAVTSGLWQRMMRPVASFAVAASVAATVVIGGQQLVQLSGGDSTASQAVASGVSPIGFVNSLGARPLQASYGNTSAVPVLSPATRTAYAELARQRMKAYSQEHAEHSALNTPQGLIPFARVPQIAE
ncbi:MAG: sigma-E factor negative regulatory protein [Halioglobus sp.]